MVQEKEPHSRVVTTLEGHRRRCCVGNVSGQLGKAHSELVNQGRSQIEPFNGSSCRGQSCRVLPGAAAYVEDQRVFIRRQKPQHLVDVATHVGRVGPLDPQSGSGTVGVVGTLNVVMLIAHPTLRFSCHPWGGGQGVHRHSPSLASAVRSSSARPAITRERHRDDPNPTIAGAA